jgi:hypothetical protein
VYVNEAFLVVIKMLDKSERFFNIIKRSEFLLYVFDIVVSVAVFSRE